MRTTPSLDKELLHELQGGYFAMTLNNTLYYVSFLNLVINFLRKKWIIHAKILLVLICVLSQKQLDINKKENVFALTNIQKKAVCASLITQLMTGFLKTNLIYLF